MVKKVFLVACVAGKRPDPVPAAELYTSTWFTKARNLIEATGAPWFILSAEHGLLSPETVIGPYERTLNKMGAAERRVWAEKVKSQMATQLPNAAEVVIFAGWRYREHLMPWLHEQFARVSVPMEGLPIGRQLSWMTHATDL